MSEVIVGGTYSHYKKENYFVEVVGIAHHSETLEKMVVYKSLQDSDEYPKGTLWARPFAMFEESVTVDGREVPRFSYVAPI